MRALAVVTVLVVVQAGCAHHVAALGQARTAFEQARYEEAKGILADIDVEILRTPIADRAQYAYLRGMTLFHLEDIPVGDSWLEEAQKLQAQQPGVLTAEQMRQVGEARTRLAELKREQEARFASYRNHERPAESSLATTESTTESTTDDATTTDKPARTGDAPKPRDAPVAVTAPEDAPQHDAATISTETCRNSRADYRINNENPNGAGAGRSGWRVQWAGAGIAGIGGFVSIWTNWNLCNTHPTEGDGDVVVESVIWRVRNDTSTAKQICFTSDVGGGKGFLGQETGPHCTTVLAPGEESYSLGPTASFSCRESRPTTLLDAHALVPTVTIYECAAH